MKAPSVTTQSPERTSKSSASPAAVPAGAHVVARVVEPWHAPLLVQHHRSHAVHDRRAAEQAAHAAREGVEVEQAPARHLPVERARGGVAEGTEPMVSDTAAPLL
jgi:hypothetical protein